MNRRAVFSALPLVVFLALAALLYVRLSAGDASKLPSALVGHPAPPLALKTLDGAPLGDADLRAGKVTVVNVFGSWCEPCHFEHPVLLALAATLKAENGKARMIGMAQKDSPENVRRFLGADGNPYSAVVLDPDGRAGIDWGVYGVPETYVVRGDGIVAFKKVGPLTQETLCRKSARRSADQRCAVAPSAACRSTARRKAPSMVTAKL
jgi:cytochrome c biogenesis protein CcmG/thiol:disulfide interchange protein DsbE